MGAAVVVDDNMEINKVEEEGKKKSFNGRIFGDWIELPVAGAGAGAGIGTGTGTGTGVGVGVGEGTLGWVRALGRCFFN